MIVEADIELLAQILDTLRLMIALLGLLTGIVLFGPFWHDLRR